MQRTESYGKRAGGKLVEGTVHFWGVRDGFRKVRHLRLVLKDKQDFEKQDRERDSKEKCQGKPRHRVLTASSLLGCRSEQFSAIQHRGDGCVMQMKLEKLVTTFFWNWLRGFERLMNKFLKDYFLSQFAYLESSIYSHFGMWYLPICFLTYWCLGWN